ncbi:hypothetical protein [Taibaiella koreensis]|uniref:hypothetical protein n=1 Tax=Taibaiella koreensis TaxID=1268548 RepID=UPI000E59A27A|nr:hypothetical protein [Taibaiella koreensis]
MDLLKLSTDWAKAELFSAKIVWLFSVIILLNAAGFSYCGKTVSAKAFVIPLFVSAAFLIAVGIGLYAANKPRIIQFEKQYRADTDSFVKNEIARTTKSKRELEQVFKILPAIVILAAILLLLFPSASWRAITVTTMLTAAFLMAVDTHTEARNRAYREQLLKFIPQ